MRPIKLELSGLNNYTDKVSIDFEKLTEKNIFGIVGNTGSGKSTILDAITIALYGELGKDNKDFINSNSDKATISYDFEIGNKLNRKKYSIDRVLSKTNTGIETSQISLAEIYKNGEKTILSNELRDIDKKILDTIGLTVDDFTRSAILPQGKFSDFLKLTGIEKRDMLERVFSLEKYGKELIYKIKFKKDEQLETLKGINIKLNQYKEVDKALYESVKNNLIELKQLEKDTVKELDITEDKYKSYQDIYEKQTQKERYEKRKKELDIKEQEIKEKVEQLENALHGEKIIPYIQSVQELEKKVSDDIKNNQDVQKHIDILNKEIHISKNKYDEAYVSKNNQMPKLSEYKTKLERAKGLEDDLKEIEKEIKEIKVKDNSLDKEKDILSKTSIDLDSKKVVVQKSIKELEDKIEKLKISVDLKQKIFKTFEIEKEYEKLLGYKNKKLERLNNLSKDLDDLNLKIKYTQRDKSLLDRKLNEVLTHYDGLNNKCPGNNEDIINKTEEISELKFKIELLREYEEKRDELQSDLNTLLENKHQIEREIHSLTDKLDISRRSKYDLEKEIEALKYLNVASELRKELKENSPCSVCGSRNHENRVSNNQDDKIEFLKTKLERVKNEEIVIKNSIDELNSKKSGCIAVEKIKKKEVEYIKNKVGDLNSKELNKKLEQDTKVLEVFKQSLLRWNGDKENNQHKLRDLLESKNSIEKEELKLEEGIKSYKISIKEIKEELENLEIKTRKAKDEYLGLKSIVKVNDLNSRVDQINKNEKQVEGFEEEYLNLNKRKESLEEKVSNYKKHIYDIDIQITKIKEIHTEKKKLRDEKYNELISITKGEPAQQLLQILDEEMKKLVNQENTTKSKLEELTNQYDEFVVEKSSIEGRLKTTKEQYETQKEILNQLLIDYRFDSTYAVKRSLLESENRRKLHDYITEYNEEYRVVDIKLRELKDILCGRSIKADVFEELKLKIYSLRSGLNQIAKDIGANESKSELLKESLLVVNELEKAKDKSSKKLELLNELYEITKDNKLVEFAASNQLKYIALEASKNLINMTDGRYSIEIDSKLDFAIKDNLNKGQQRSISTLSGGETFLTSLALAIALSSQIQLKGNSPLETLFLDEGFGSLDSDLLSSVMCSLEKLDKDKLSIGIISHVDNLNTRFPRKLVVQQNDLQSGTKIIIE